MRRVKVAEYLDRPHDGAVTADRVHVRLLGTPSAEAGGRTLPRPRGRKSWAVLARLALADRPIGRAELARLLFADADDPLGALRWTLAELRRTLGLGDAFTGDPLTLRDDQFVIDARVLDRGGSEALRVAEQAGELLDGIALDGCPEFETWLVIVRQRLRSRADGHLRNAAMHALATGDTATAVRLAGLAVASTPYDEPLQELLVRALARNGDVNAAHEQASRAERILRTELGITPGPSLRAAAGEPVARPHAPAAAAVVESLIAAGRAAVGAGAVDAGIETLRRAATLAHSKDGRARALLAIGSALVHGVRGRDEEGAVALHESLVLARAAADLRTTIGALRELAFVDVQAGRVAMIDARLDEALDLAADDDELAAGVLGVRGMHICDRGDAMGSLDPLLESVDRAERGGQPRQAAWSRGLAGRSLLLLGDHSGARAALDQSITGCQAERWQAYLPFPMAIKAEVALAEGRDDSVAGDALHIAFALGCQLGDPCWEGLAARGLAIVAARAGDFDSARTTIRDAHTRCFRHPDRYVSIEAWVLAAEVAISEAAGESAELPRTRLHALASRTEQPFFLTDEATSSAVPLGQYAARPVR